MQIYELEVSNYKCLENYGMPLRFDKLNVLIGANDAGKTTLFEVIQIILGHKTVTEEVFFDSSKEIKIKIKFDNLNKDIINNALSLEEHSFTIMDYYLDITSLEDMWKHYNEEINSGNKPLKSFSFYKDLKFFYESFYNDPLITAIFKFRLSEDKAVLSEYPILYLDHKESIKKSANAVANNKEFVNFIEKYRIIADKQSKEITDKLIDLNVLIFWVTIEEFGMFLKDYLFKTNNVIDEGKKKCLLDLIRKFNYQKIFKDDSIEIKYSKIARLLTTLINKENNDLVNLTLEYYLDSEYFGLNQQFLNTEERIRLDAYAGKGYIEFYNIFGNYLLEFGKQEECPDPILRVFDIEVNKEDITSKIFKDLFQGQNNLNNYISKEIEKYLSEELDKIIKDASFKYLEFLGQDGNSYYDDVRKYFKDYMFLLGEQISDFYIDFISKKIDAGILKEIIDTEIFIKIRERKKDIDINQKGLGFLRKLLISDFLILTKNLNEISDDKDIKNTIFLVEEPELHLHYSSQKLLMRTLCENLQKSNNQIFITTHSHFVVEETDFKDIFIFKKNNDLGISSITNSKKFKEDPSSILYELRNSLGLTKTELLSLSKVAVFVEGIRDKVLLETLCKRPDQNINLERIFFIIVQGQDKMDSYVKSDLITDLLELRIIMILDNSPENLKRKEMFQNDKKVNKKIRENIIDIIMLDKVDILNYLDLDTIEEYYGLNKGSINTKNDQLKVESILEKNFSIRIKEEDIQKIVLKMKNIHPELLNVLNKIKAIQDALIGFDISISLK